MTTVARAEKEIAVREKEQQALALRKQGIGYVAIADQLKCSLGNAHRLVQRALERITTPDAEELKKLELERLDAMQAGLWKSATNGGYLSVDRILGIMQRRAALTGIDMTAKPDILVLVAAVHQSARDSGMTIEQILDNIPAEMAAKLRPVLQIEGPKGG